MFLGEDLLAWLTLAFGGALFVGNLLARPDGPINEIDPATIQIGEPVQVTFQPIDDIHLPRWLRR